MSISETIPFFGTQRESAVHEEEFVDVVRKVLRGGKTLQGSEVATFEQEITRRVGRQFGIAVNSCTDALYYALVASGVRPGDEVLVTDFSFVASASCIVRVGAIPVFVDIADDYNMNFNDADKKMSSKTKALVCVHLYGLMNPPHRVEKFCKEHNLILIEDAAQAFGALRDGRSAGSLGLVSCLSFDPTKPLSAPGSGGIVLTDDSVVADKVRKLRYHGRDSAQQFVELGYNSQMSSIVAAVLSSKLRHEEKWRRKRWNIANRYHQGFADLPLRLPKSQNNENHIFHKYVIWTEQRDELLNHLVRNNIPAMVHYAKPLHLQKVFGHVGGGDDCSCAFKAAKGVLSLPIHPFLSNDEVAYIIKTIKDFFS